MTKKEKFVEFVDNNLFCDIDTNEVDPDIIIYWNALKDVQEKEKPMFTDNGKMILRYLQSLPTDTPPMKAKDIAAGMDFSSRTVSGAMKKLVLDNFIEKIGDAPCLYQLTESGRNITIED